MKQFPAIILALILACGCLFPLTTAVAATETIDVPSAKMNKTYQAVVILPATYATNEKPYPVLYLLHGGFGHFGDWTSRLKDTTLLQRLADQYQFIVAMPEGEVFSYYIDSPVDEASQFETYLTQEVIEKIDDTYRTIENRNGRVITGLSMGGYGAFYLAARHPDLYCAAGSMSGALNPDLEGWRLPESSIKGLRGAFARILGSIEEHPDRYAAASVLKMDGQLKAAELALTFDCGLDDQFIDVNLELHQRLIANKTPHDYTERPGGHGWPYWENSLPYHVLFFHDVLKKKGTAIVP
jgi:S-formylglutathione hydrolase FrmB